jgi:hypothetical protein
MENNFLGTYNCPICTKSSPHSHDLINHWIGVDFDNTLAYDSPTRHDPYSLGEPIIEMVNRVKDWIARGYTVKIFTARMCDFSYTSNQSRDVDNMRSVLEAWCLKHIGKVVECTNQKDGAMEVLWDDRAVRVAYNMGKPEHTS